MNANVMPEKTAETWSVAVLYENTEMRQRAMQVCDHFIEQFWSEIEFDVGWWRFGFLQDEALSQQATEQIIGADVIIVATASERDLPATVVAWLGEALTSRGMREGMFVALSGHEKRVFGQWTGSKDAVLKNLAQRAGMDYFTDIPAPQAGGLPDSLDNYSQRAEEHTTLIESILKHSPRTPMHP